MAVSGCLSSETDDSDNSAGNNAYSEEEKEPDSDNDGIPDHQDDYPNDPTRSVKNSNSGYIDVQEDEWYRWELDFDTKTHIEYETIVRDGPSIDVILFDESEYRHYEMENRAKFYSGLSDLNTSRGRARGWVEPGNYRLVVDNTNWGEAKPPSNFNDDVAEVEYSLTFSR